MTSEMIRVVLTTPVEESNLQKIRAVSERLKVDQLSPLILAERKGDVSKKAELDALFGEAEVVYGWIHHFPKNLLSRAPRLKWIQTMSAGVDRLPEDIMKSPVRVANASGLHGTPMAEVVLQMMLMFAKDAPSCFQMKVKKEWKRYTPNAAEGANRGSPGPGRHRKRNRPALQSFRHDRSGNPQVLYGRRSHTRMWTGCISGISFLSFWPAVISWSSPCP